MKVKLEDLVPGRVYRDVDGDEGLWDGERFQMKDGYPHYVSAEGPYASAGWVDVTPERPGDGTPEPPGDGTPEPPGDGIPTPILRRLFCAEFDFADSRLDEEGYLDEMVHDLKSEEATNINDDGLRAQLLYLLGLE